MSTNTGIEWTDATWNPVVGCERVSPGCAHCYAKQLHDQRHRAHVAGKPVAPQYHVPFEMVQLKPERLTAPLGWRKPRRVFVNSVSDLFHDDVPAAYIDRVFATMALSPRHSYQMLTKRPARMRAYVSALGTPAGYDRLEAGAREVGYTLRFEGIPLVPWPLPNVWLGVSVENQRWADERIPLLLDTPAAVRFLSCEPLLGPVNFDDVLGDWWAGINWVIVGGESGLNARPMDAAWARGIRDQCVAEAVAFFFKQWGGRTPKAGGRLLDGREWNEMPGTPTTTPTTPHASTP